MCAAGQGRTARRETDLPVGMVIMETGAPSRRKHCKKAIQAAKRALGRQRPSKRDARGPKTIAVAPEEAALTGAQWALIEPLLPSRSGRIGRPLQDHRGVLGSILWVARTGCSWREMPEKYGDFSTAYRRWRVWKERGLWQRILQTLGWEEFPGPATKGS